MHANSLPITLLTAIHIFGINSTYGLVLRNGCYDALFHQHDNGPHLLPGSNTPISATFTGITPLDKLVTLVGVMFGKLTDGSDPALSLYAFHFAGQLVPIMTVMAVESVRRGNKGNIFRYSVIWGILMQSLGYGFTMPLYCILQLSLSSTARSIDPSLIDNIRIVDSGPLETLPRSIFMGYIVPTILMVVPVSSSGLHQWLGGLWQGFPIWVMLAQWSARDTKNATEKASYQARMRKRESSGDRIGELMILHRVYLFAFGIAALTQSITIGLLLLRTVCPYLLPLALRQSWTLADVFLPSSSRSWRRTPDAARCVLDFFQYDQYVGSAGAIVWALTLHCNSRREPMRLRHWLWLISEMIGISLLAGPAGALASLMWNRDERVIGVDQEPTSF